MTARTNETPAPPAMEASAPEKGTPLDETWNYRIPESLADLISLFENRIACHRLWAEWLDQDTDETRRYAEHGIGPAKAHWDYVKQYSAAKSLVEGHLRAARPSPVNGQVTDALRRGVALVSALLRYFNPNDMPEDQSQQWQQLEHWAKTTALSTPLPAQETRQVAWLIEHKGYAGSTLPHWYAENEDAITVHASLATDAGVARRWHWWTPTASEAKRFASKAEAEAFPPYQMIASDPAISVTEHVFLASPPSPDKGAVTEAMVEIAAKAMDDAEFGFSLMLTRLVDGVSTYTLTYSDGSPQLEFEDTDRAYEHVAQRKRLTQARAALTTALGAGSGAEHG